MSHERVTADSREASSGAKADRREPGDSANADDTSRVVAADRRRPGNSEPPYLHADYRSTLLRAPSRPLFRIPYGPSELSGPVPAALVVGSRVHPNAADLTLQHAGEPLGERIVVHGRLVDGEGRPIPGALVEVWQANASGRYAHDSDQHPAPLDPNFTGAGFCLTDRQGYYRFVTIKPGAYPWKNHANAWRPAHVHFSVLGHAFSQRLLTQMYFPGDPLLEYDPIFLSIPDAQARARLIARFDPSQTMPDWALAYRFDLVVAGREATPVDRVGAT
jgi:protocatechuate 3,4-dioxygenase beta subunit